MDDTGKRPVLRPRIKVVTTEPVPVPVGRDAVLAGPPGAEGEGDLRDPGGDGRTEVVLELSGGMGRGLTAPPGSVPEVGERLCSPP